MKVTIRKTEDEGFYVVAVFPLTQMKRPVHKVYPTKAAVQEGLRDLLFPDSEAARPTSGETGP